MGGGFPEIQFPEGPSASTSRANSGESVRHNMVRGNDLDRRRLLGAVASTAALGATGCLHGSDDVSGLGPCSPGPSTVEEVYEELEDEGGPVDAEVGGRVVGIGVEGDGFTFVDGTGEGNAMNPSVMPEEGDCVVVSGPALQAGQGTALAIGVDDSSEVEVVEPE